MKAMPPTSARKLLIAGAARLRPRVLIVFGGRLTRATLLSADAEGASFKLRDIRMPLGWKQIPPARFHGIAAHFAQDTPAGHLLLARYCAAMGLDRQARSEIEKASRDEALSAQAEKLKGLLP